MKNWTNVRYIRVDDGVLAGKDLNATWAPEIYYDSPSGEFYIIFSSGDQRYDGGNLNHNFKTYYKRTQGRNFNNLTATQVLYDPSGKFEIDAVPLRANGQYYLFLKVEDTNAGGSGWIKDGIHMATSNSITGPYGGLSGRLQSNMIGNSEAPSPIKIGSRYFLYYDFPNGLNVATSNNLSYWQDYTSKVQSPPNFRHGTVRKIRNSVTSPDPNKWYYIINDKDGRYMADNGSGDAVAWSANTVNTRQWRFIDAGNGYYNIESRSGYWLANATAEDNDARLWSQLNYSGRRWRLRSSSIPGYFNIQNEKTGGYLANWTYDHDVYVWNDQDNNSRRWKLVEAGDVSNSGFNGTYKIIARNSGKALDVDGASTSNGANVIQYTYGGGDNQKWTITPVGGGYYKIIAKHSGKALDVAGINNGANIQQWTYGGGANQQWEIVPVNANARTADATAKANLSVEESEESALSAIKEVMVYPNPSQGQVVIQYPGEQAEIILTNLQGQQIMSLQSRGGEVLVNTAGLPKGVFLLSVSSEHGLKQQKLVVE